MVGKRDSDSNTDIRYSCDDETPCEQTFCETKRRRLLGALSAGGSLALAGCTGIIAAPETETVPGSETSYTLNFLREEQDVEARANMTVLRSAEKAGLELPYFCRAGYCGQCLSKADGDANEVVEMAVNDFDSLTAEAVEEGYFLPCTSQPRDDFTVTSEIPAADLEEFQEEPDEEDEDPDDEEDEDEDEEAVGTRHPITFENEGWIVPIGEEESLLFAAEDAGIEGLPYACREGFCGQCLARIDGDANELVEMTVNDYDPLDEDAMAEGYTLTCTGQPRDRFSLESDVVDDLE